MLRNWPKMCGSEFGGLLWRRLTPQRKTAIWVHNYSHSCAQQPKRYFGNFTFYMTFLFAHIRSFRAVFWTTYMKFDNCCQSYIATCGKSVYRCKSTFSALNYCGWIFFKSLSGAHKLFRRFLDFSQFLTASSRKLWRRLAIEIRTL